MALQHQLAQATHTWQYQAQTDHTLWLLTVQRERAALASALVQLRAGTIITRTKEALLVKAEVAGELAMRRRHTRHWQREVQCNTVYPDADSGPDPHPKIILSQNRFHCIWHSNHTLLGDLRGVS